MTEEKKDSFDQWEQEKSEGWPIKGLEVVKWNIQVKADS